MKTREDIQSEIADSLSDALFRVNKAKGIVILMADDDDSVWTFAGGDFITKLGLFQAAAHKAKDLWAETTKVEEGE